VTLTTWHPLSAKIGTKFGNKRQAVGRSVQSGRYSPVDDLGHGVFVFYFMLPASKIYPEGSRISVNTLLSWLQSRQTQCALQRWIAMNYDRLTCIKFYKDANGRNCLTLEDPKISMLKFCTVTTVIQKGTPFSGSSTAWEFWIANYFGLISCRYNIPSPRIPNPQILWETSNPKV
jgi:hypothetical protein